MRIHSKDPLLAVAALVVFPLLVLAGCRQSYAQVSPISQPIFPLSQVHRGLHGTAYTVFQGSTPEAMDVEILGVLHDAIGPGKDMILARLVGTRPEYTGVVAGMSGSPVYIDGKLLGAIGFRIGQFSKQPIAGITPIQQMLDVFQGTGTQNNASAGNTKQGLAQESNETNESNGSTGGLESSLSSLTSAGTEQPPTNMPVVEPIETPLVFDGFSPAALNLFRRQFSSLGMVPVSGLGSASPNEKDTAPIVPGSSISAVIVEGDLNISATCTVTYVDAKHLLACGHPVTRFGNISLPMTKAEVVATIASPLDPIKIINTTETVGAFTEDRQSGILGSFGMHANMIPVTVSMEGIPHPRTYHFSVADNPRLTAGAVTVSIFQAMQGTNGYNDGSSYRLHSVIAVDGHTPVTIDDLLAPGAQKPTSLAAALAVGQRFTSIFSNPQQLPNIRSVTVTLDAIPQRLSATIQDARVIDPVVHPGDSVTVEATLVPYRQARRVVRIPVQLPNSLPSGPVRLLVSDGATLDHTLHLVPNPALPPLGLDATIAQLNRLHPNDRLYVTLLSPVPQANLHGHDLPAVPLSMANVLEPEQEGAGFLLEGETAVPLGSKPVGLSLSGSQVMTLEVQP